MAGNANDLDPFTSRGSPRPKTKPKPPKKPPGRASPYEACKSSSAKQTGQSNVEDVVHLQPTPLLLLTNQRSSQRDHQDDEERSAAEPRSKTPQPQRKRLPATLPRYGTPPPRRPPATQSPLKKPPKARPPAPPPRTTSRQGEGEREGLSPKGVRRGLHRAGTKKIRLPKDDIFYEEVIHESGEDDGAYLAMRELNQPAKVSGVTVPLSTFESPRPSALAGSEMLGSSKFDSPQDTHHSSTFRDFLTRKPVHYYKKIGAVSSQDDGAYTNIPVRSTDSGYSSSIPRSNETKPNYENVHASWSERREMSSRDTSHLQPYLPPRDVSDSTRESPPPSIGPPLPLRQPVQSTHFTEAERRAQVPFLHHKVLSCDSSGLEYPIKDHDITLRIPAGAVPAGKKIHFEIAVAMFGPFKFPEDTQPISPILWLCILEDCKLGKPFQVIVPHFLTGLTKEGVEKHGIAFTKANHLKHSEEGGQMKYTFQPCDENPYLATYGGRSFGILSTHHCCFYCLQANQTSELAMDAGYCLTRIEAFVSQQRSEVHFAAVYCLPTCLRAVEEQYQCEGSYRITSYSDFTFNKDVPDPHLKVIPFEHSQFVVALEPTSARIRAADINFWRKGFDAMQLRHERKMYPPKVKMTIAMKCPDKVIKLPVRIEGCSSDSQLDAELTFPLGFPSSDFSSSSSGSQLEPQSQKIICERPKLKAVLKQMLPLAAKWKIIGTMLEIEDHVISRIRADEDGVCDCLQEMLTVWLKQVDPPPTWSALAEAVEVADELIAEEIRTRFVDT